MGRRKPPRSIMSDLKPKTTKIILGGKEYGLLFSLNAIDALQDKLDAPISQLSVLMKDERKVFKILRTLLTVLINEAIDDSESGAPHVDESFIGRKITVSDIATLRDKAFYAFNDGMPEPEGDDPNVTSE